MLHGVRRHGFGHGNGSIPGITPLRLRRFSFVGEEMSTTKCWNVAYLKMGIVLLLCNNYNMLLSQCNHRIIVSTNVIVRNDSAE